MLIEHIIYSLAIAIIFGIVYQRFTGRDLSWIIILSAFAPDMDILALHLLIPMGIEVQVQRSIIGHGDFHNLGFLIFYALLAAILLTPFGFKFMDVLIFAAVGFGVHLLEDFVVYPEGYSYLWPITTQRLGMGSYQRNFFGLADVHILAWGLAFLAFALVLRTLSFRRCLTTISTK